MNSIIWFRRDLRVTDHFALSAAVRAAESSGGRVLALFVLDPRLVEGSGPARVAFLFGCLRNLRESGVSLLVRTGPPASIVADVADEADANVVHVSGDFSPYGRTRDAAVREALGRRGKRLVETGSPYAVDPGRVVKPDGTPFRVFTPFSKAWTSLARGTTSEGSVDPLRVPWLEGLAGEELPSDEGLATTGWAAPGEAAAVGLWEAFQQNHLRTYDETRNAPGLDATSRLSPYLKFGCIHPRQLLQDLRESEPSRGSQVFEAELCWREFYADVLFHRPDTVTRDFVTSLAEIHHDESEQADARFAAWAGGQTGYPIVDAGMRQLLSEGWMHNRVRMIVASFLVKDLHLEWQRGAKHFMRYLIDGDIASNQHGWQWTAGTGTDAAPYFRVFNPTLQGEKFDPDGAYVRRFVPELAHLRSPSIHRPRPLDAPGYPQPIVDHATEREVALSRYRAARSANGETT